MVADYILNKVLDKIKEIIDIEQFDNTNILKDTDDTMSYDITLKKVDLFITSVTKDDNKFYSQLILEYT